LSSTSKIHAGGLPRFFLLVRVDKGTHDTTSHMFQAAGGPFFCSPSGRRRRGAACC
jgi:hypothetical protein